MMKVTPGWRNPSKIPGHDPPSVADFGVDFCANFYHLASARRRILRCPSQIRVEDLLATMLDSGSF